MKVVWSKQSVHSLREVVKFYTRTAGSVVAQRIKNQIIEISTQLSTQPKIGSIEPILEFKKLGHRYLIAGHGKIIYVVLPEDILITDVFDTRQNPNKLEKEL